MADARHATARLPLPSASCPARRAVATRLPPTGWHRCGGYAVTGVREAEHITERLADICGRIGRPDEAREFRQQAEKDRRRAGRATAWAVPTVPAGEPRAAKQYPAGRTGRNQPCPCGSGKKFKKCCGALRRHERTGATCALRWPVAQHSPAAAGRGMRRSLARPLTDRAGHRPRSRRGGTGPAIVTECHVSAAGANGKGGAETGGPGVLRPARMDCLELAKASHISRTTRTTCG